MCVANAISGELKVYEQWHRNPSNTNWKDIYIYRFTKERGKKMREQMNQWKERTNESVKGENKWISERREQMNQ